MQQVADREPDVVVPDTHRKDELGELARILVAFSERLDVTDKLERDNKLRQVEQQRVVERLSAALGDLADGNLTRSIDTPFADEYDQLRLDYNRSVETLADTVSELLENSKVFAWRADEIAASSGELSKRN